MAKKPQKTYQELLKRSYLELIQGYCDKGYKLAKYGSVKELGQKYDLYKIVIDPKARKTLLITAGFHGEETKSPISLLQIFDDIVRYANEMRVRLIVYPCINPFGFETGRRYSPSTPRGMGNNDFMRYEIEPDKWVGILKENEPSLSCRIVDSKAREVSLLKHDVLEYRVPEAVLDIHQQKGYLETGETFAYIFDRRPTYKRIMKKVGKIAKIARNEDNPLKDKGREIPSRIDNDGFIEIHDGSITDMFYCLGSIFAVTCETKTDLPLEKVCQINLIWAKDLIKLIAKRK
ncbi:MAG: hypothetical protein A2469_02545 [Candidatus Magasanikbacteria bacterium RIFOXYC2_FULL_40_16]|uniref:Peptidase M14 domain-containing protein n=1 Tax=Candidatus Magasanikbacteria bacterium RIFOXYC2_FULL_40_16 TaxID=1798703 RepID=A0A1F6P188_9BACT|nr:MAG: hypothetical protein A2469_02545 [Candidatus Magasanikbacteria bacterium RIFOXYC2_FULL_40_16]